jgi:hypothetical protein
MKSIAWNPVEKAPSPNPNLPSLMTLTKSPSEIKSLMNLNVSNSDSDCCIIDVIESSSKNKKRPENQTNNRAFKRSKIINNNLNNNQQSNHTNYYSNNNDNNLNNNQKHHIITPNSAAASAIAIANQSNMNGTQSCAPIDEYTRFNKTMLNYKNVRLNGVNNFNNNNIHLPFQMVTMPNPQQIMADYAKWQNEYFEQWKLSLMRSNNNNH